MHSCGVIPTSVCRLGGSGSCRRGPVSIASPATYTRPFREPRALLVSRLSITHHEAMSTFPKWMAAAA